MKLHELSLFVAALLIAIATAIAQQNHIFDGHLWVAYFLYVAAAMLIAWTVGHFYSGKRDHKTASSTPPSSPQQNVRQEANPHQEQHVYFGDEFLRRHSPRPPQNSPEIAEPNIRCLGVTTARISQGLDSSVFFEQQDRGDEMVIARFRNDVTEHSSVLEPYLRAQIIYKNTAGDEVTDLPAGIWLNERRRYTQFTSGETKTIILLAAQDDNSVLKLWKEYRTVEGGQVIDVRHETIVDEVASIELRLLIESDGRAGGGCIANFFFEVVEWNDRPLPILTLGRD